MATGYFSVMHTNGKTVYFQFYDAAAVKFFDFDDDTWQAAPTTKKLAAAEQTEMGDADESLYTASTDLSDLNSTSTPLNVIVQAVDDLGTDELISTSEMVITAGEESSGIAAPSTPTLTVTNDGDGDAVTATVDGDAAATNTLYYRKTTDSAWTTGNNRSGDGDIAQAGLDNNTDYWFTVQSAVGGQNSLQAPPVLVHVSGSTITHTYNVISVLTPDERREYTILACIEVDD